MKLGNIWWREYEYKMRFGFDEAMESAGEFKVGQRKYKV